MSPWKEQSQLCGISGWVAKRPIPVERTYKMTDAVKHRGPDGEGFAFFDIATNRMSTFDGTKSIGRGLNLEHERLAERSGLDLAQVGFGHRRLAIIDLSAAGHQPMSRANGRYWIIYNGEVYNYLELRQELEAFGHQFQSATDTEVVLAAYEQWGIGCFSRFNGMWALAILDRLNSTVVLARDRFGVKPLYYWVSSEGVLHFGSEIKQFSQCPDWQARLNHSRVADFLFYDMQDHTDETMFQGVYQLPGGCVATIDIRATAWTPAVRIGHHRWYELCAAPFSGHFHEACEEFHRILRSAVALRLRADVDVGSCLSGGLDSSAIVCLASQLLAASGAGGRQRTFSLTCDEPKFDERPWMDDVLQKSGARGAFVQASAEAAFDSMAELAWHQDEPFGSSGICGQWAVFQLAASSGCKVLLDGQGADELLGGYHSSFPAAHAYLASRGCFNSLRRELVAARKNHGFGYLKMLCGAAFALAPDRLRDWGQRTIRNAPRHYPWLNHSRLLEADDSEARPTRGKLRRSIRALSRQQLLKDSLPRLLHFEDRNSMAASIETRLPFLDYRLVEFALGLPDSFKLRDGTTKIVLRESMRGIIPDSVRERHSKLGFATGEANWAHGAFAERYRNSLRIAVQCGDGLVFESVLEHFEKIATGTAPYNAHIWRVISFGEWSRCFLTKNSP